MKASELRERTSDELEKLESQLGRNLWQARFDNFANQLDDTSKISRFRRDLARVKTILTERAQAAALDAGATASESTEVGRASGAGKE